MSWVRGCLEPETVADAHLVARGCVVRTVITKKPMRAHHRVHAGQRWCAMTGRKGSSGGQPGQWSASRRSPQLHHTNHAYALIGGARCGGMDGSPGPAHRRRFDLREFNGHARLSATRGADADSRAAVARQRHRCDAGGQRIARYGPRHDRAAVAAWPAVALVGSYELLMMIIRSAQIPSSFPNAHAVSSVDPLHEAAKLFAEDLMADRVPSSCAIQARLHVGQPRAQRIRGHLPAINGGG
jgi:hypothetical protein